MARDSVDYVWESEADENLGVAINWFLSVLSKKVPKKKRGLRTWLLERILKSLPNDDTARSGGGMPGAGFTQPDGAESSELEFTLRMPFGTFEPKPYRFFLPFNELKEELDIYLAKLLAEGSEVNAAHMDVLDSMIATTTQNAFAHLDYQKVVHLQALKQLEMRHTSDRKAFADEIVTMQAELTKTEAEYDAIQARRDSLKFI